MLSYTHEYVHFHIRVREGDQRQKMLNKYNAENIIKVIFYLKHFDKTLGGALLLCAKILNLEIKKIELLQRSLSIGQNVNQCNTS